MGGTDSTNKTLKESINGWPHLSWVSSYAGKDPLIPDLSRAVLDDVRERDEAVVITAREGERGFTATVPVDDPVMRRAIVASLKKAIGTTLKDAGDEVVAAARGAR